MSCSSSDGSSGSDGGCETAFPGCSSRRPRLQKHEIMTGREFEEPDFEKHVATVLSDYRDGVLDGLDEAVEAIVEHPAVRDCVQLRVVGPLDLDEP